MRSLMTRLNVPCASRAALNVLPTASPGASPLGSAWGKRPLPFAAGAVTLALLGASAMAPSPATAQTAPTGTAGASSLLGVDALNGPIVTIVSPQYNDQLRGGAQVLVAVQARKHTPRTIEMYVDGRLASPPGQPLVDLPSANFSWDTSRFADGPHRLSVVVTDTQGFRGGADVNIYINNNRLQDLTPPALEWLSVRQGDTWRGLVDIQLKAVDNFGVKLLFISLNPAATPLKKPAAFSWLLNRPPYLIKGWDSRRLPDGLYSLRATAYDSLENEGSASALTVTIANHSINPTYNLPQVGAGGSRVEVRPNIPGGAAPDAAEPIEGSDTMQTDAAPAAEPATEPSAAAPANSVAEKPRVARSGGRSGRRATGEPSLSAAPQAREGRAAAPAAPRGSGEEQRALSSTGRVAAWDAVPRTLKKAAGGAALSRLDMISPEGAAVAPRGGASSAAKALGQRASLLAAAPRRVPGATSTSGAAGQGASLSMAPGMGGSRVAGASEEREPTERAELTPSMAPSLPRVASRSVASAPRAGGAREGSQPLLSGAGEARAASPQGSVVAPSFPRVDLIKRGPSAAPRSTGPQALAAAPPAEVAKRLNQAAITVVPSLSSGLPTLHRVLKGETLASVASRYNLPASVLAMHNGLDAKAPLKAGQSVRLPQALAVSLAGEVVRSDVASMMVGGVGVTPFRFLFEKQGGSISWDVANQRVTARNATHQVTLTIGSAKALVGTKQAVQKDVMMDLAAFLVSGRTMVPLRFFEKALNASVEWEPATGRLLVAMAQ